jgi:hypothetical protein
MGMGRSDVYCWVNEGRNSVAEKVVRTVEAIEKMNLGAAKFLKLHIGNSE